MLRWALLHIARPKVDLYLFRALTKSFVAPTSRNIFRDSDPAPKCDTQAKLPLSQQVRINSVLLLSKIRVRIMASRVVEELVAGEVPT